MKILFAASECFPYVKTGGLADVVGSLPKELVAQGAEVCVMLPKYRQIDDYYIYRMEHICHFNLQLGSYSVFCGIDSLVQDNVRFYFIDNLAMFGGDKVYTGDEEEGFRFAFFCRAVLESFKYLNYYPDIIHCNDWQTGLIPVLLNDQYRGLDGYRDVHTVYTIHNLKYQGLFDWKRINSVLGLNEGYFSPNNLEFYGLLSFMKAGLVFANRITTVSPTYAEEIRTGYYGERLDGLLRARHNVLSGILNGIDVISFDPSTDIQIPYHYNAEDPSNKKLCKAALQEELGLEKRDVPLIGLVSRLTSQKGLDLITCVLNDIMRMDVQMIIVGTGDAYFENAFRDAQYRFPGRFVTCLRHDENMARKTYAACDMYLMPSQFEPCGLSQMIAMRYGTIPIVRETGGLRDSVLPYNWYTDDGNGFSFHDYNAHDMLHVMEQAVGYWYDQKDMWARLVKRAMKTDFSWAVSARRYMELYRSVLGIPEPAPKPVRRRTTKPAEPKAEKPKAAAKPKTAEKPKAAEKPKTATARKPAAKKTKE